jgi:hypothetical protein
MVFCWLDDDDDDDDDEKYFKDHRLNNDGHGLVNDTTTLALKV